MTGFIKLHRKILDWEWYSDINTRCLFMHFLLKANFQTKRWQGIAIKKGSFVTSLDTLVNEVGLTKQQVRRCLKLLKTTREIKVEANNRFQIITVINYAKYQENQANENTQETYKQRENSRQTTDKEHAGNTQRTRQQHTSNTQRTSTKKGKKESIKKNNLTVIPKKEQFLSTIYFEYQKPLAEWLEYRKDLKDQKQWQFQYNKLKTFSNPQEAVDFSIGQGYRGLFEPKQNFNSNNQKSGTVEAIKEVSNIIEESGLGDERPKSAYL